MNATKLFGTEDNEWEGVPAANGPDGVENTNADPYGSPESKQQAEEYFAAIGWATTKTFQIETQDRWGNWSPEGVGDADANKFGTEADALAAIESLKVLGEEWATSTYRVTEVTA